jgi:uncharacterized protein YbjT (DUF2867 family)
MLTLTETNGKINTVHHFDSKAKVEEYARAEGVPSTFFMPSVFASGTYGSIRKVDTKKKAIPLSKANVA